MSKVVFTSNLNNAIKAIGRGAKKGVEASCLDLINKTIPVTPLQSGDLRGSLNARFEDLPDGYKGTVGSALDYSLTVHEDLSRNFKEPGTGAKYLERSAIENENLYRRFIADAIRDETG